MKCSGEPGAHEAQRDVVWHFAALQPSPDLFELLTTLH